jgi:hypothetical protein
MKMSFFGRYDKAAPLYHGMITKARAMGHLKALSFRVLIGNKCCQLETVEPDAVRIPLYHNLAIIIVK